jgi:fructokinase
MDEEGPLVAGVELGGTKCIAVLARGRTIIEDIRIATEEPDETLASLHAVVTGWVRTSAVAALGIASFGPIMLDRADDQFGHLLLTTKPGWSGADIGRLAEGFAGPVAIDTDVNAAALAEWRWGGGIGLDVLAYLTIGTGIGGGLIMNGRPVHGLLHPEMGHVFVRRSPGDKFPGVCPIHGDCLEGLASGPAIAARAGMAAKSVPAGDPAWRLAGEALGEMLVSLVLIAAPQRVLIGGGIGIGQPQLLAAARSVLARRLNHYVPRPELDAGIERFVAPAQLGNQAGPLGAVALALGALAG